MDSLDGFYVTAVRDGLHWDNVQGFRERVAQELEAACLRLLIDLRGTVRADSTGLGALLQAHTRAHRAAGNSASRAWMRT
ncbi:hypothetical protein SA2016_1000 [Sinomonas atrocyanea]|uniref:STAS domain-containing protein n=1 Tax=Sinomonas atrocyanea TaxID=37927 RepID=A0A126ZZ52_9MICC|nr:STAS domain-containing protein [Sinomonas atrocyanea]AMM31685.1 hypothetical protein SA2016_1000 [Sinomonas atrocyanea]GEB65327.1 hypothetical protein SAT01_27750 [Sinomonas atrocyanea]GGG59207.1 hypothetical protein GCM10007172_07600 [Sinomonas atrocyanea]